MTTIKLTQGRVALVDDADLPLVIGRKWQAAKRDKLWYAVSASRDSVTGCWGVILMHRLLLPGVSRIDHEDGDGLNNRRQNLRPCTQSQNIANSRPRGGTSQYKGVCWLSGPGRRKRWLASITVGRKAKCLGVFAQELDAAKAYNAAAIKAWGVFARLNRVDGIAHAFD